MKELDISHRRIINSRQLPERLESLILEELRRAKSGGILSEARIEEVQNSVRRGIKPDYERQWAAFAYLYYVVNFAKAYTAISSYDITHKTSLKILDLGCGGGASSAGVVSSLLDRGMLPKNLTIHGIDTSHEQIDLYNRTCGAWIRGIRPTASVYLSPRDVLEQLRQDEESWDIVIASYVICELQPHQRRQARELLTELTTRRRHRTALLIDNCDCLTHEECGHPCSAPVLRLLHSDFTAFLKYPAHGLSTGFLSHLGFANSPKQFARPAQSSIERVT